MAPGPGGGLLGAGRLLREQAGAYPAMSPRGRRGYDDPSSPEERMAEESAAAVPTLVSLLICDQVIDDRLTRKKSVIGLFNTVIVPGVPATINRLVVLASVTEIVARTPLELRLVRDADNAVLFRSAGHVEAPSPLATVDLVFQMQGVRIPEPGQYAFELLSSGQILGRRRFQLVVGRPRTGRPPGPPGPLSPPASPHYPEG